MARRLCLPLLVLAGLVFAPGRALAVPAAPIVVVITQPDGATFQARAWGDEHLSGVETVEGYTVIEDEESGFWYYAEVDAGSGQLQATALLAGRDAPPAAALLARPVNPTLSAQAVTAYSNGSVKGISSLPVLVILAEYGDGRSIGSSETDWESAVFGASDSARAYYREVSYDQFTLARAAESCGTANNGVTNWRNLGATNPKPGKNDTKKSEVAAAAIESANACVDFSRYDANKDKIISSHELLVIVIMAGYEAAYGADPPSPNVWGTAFSTTTGAVDGITGFDYAIFGEWHATSASDMNAHRATTGIIVHEMGHLLGWPDLYDVTAVSPTKGVGDWSVMGSGSWLPRTGTSNGSNPAHPSAWEKWYQGWLWPVTLWSSAINVPMARVEDNRANSVIVVPANPNGVDWSYHERSGTGEYFMIENRQQVGYDADLPGCGLLIWHIDETRTSSNNANALVSRRLVDLEEADGRYDLDKLVGDNKGDDGDPYPGSSGNTRFSYDGAPKPTSRFYEGPSYISITDISPACADTKFADMSNISTFVDRAAPGVGANGTLASPYNTLAAGVGHAADYGTVGLFPGAYNEPMTLSRPMTIRSTDGGLVVIGRP